MSVCESDLKALTGYDLSHPLVLVRPAMETSLSFNLYHSENQTTYIRTGHIFSLSCLRIKQSLTNNQLGAEDELNVFLQDYQGM